MCCMHLWNSHEMVAAQLHERPLKPEESQQTEKASRLWEAHSHLKQKVEDCGGTAGWPPV